MRRTKRRFGGLLRTLFCGVLAAAGTFPSHTAAQGPAPPITLPDGVERIGYEVLRRVDHDPTAFTQGLLWYQDRLFESTGLYGGQSSVRRVSPLNGEVESLVRLSDRLFGEGLARIGDRLLQLTWKAGIAIEYDLASLAPTGRQHRYAGEGWGLCHDGKVLWMSNGSSALTARDPRSFGVLNQVAVRFGGRPLPYLNELECVGGSVFANVWQTDYIVRIDVSTGQVDGLLDLRDLYRQRAPGADVLNGIAYRPETDTFFLTGKKWPVMFEVRLTGTR